MRERRNNSSPSSLTFLGMIMVVLSQASTMVVNKVALTGGTNKFILILYTNTLATLILLPSSLFLHRRSYSPPLTPSLPLRFFLLSVIGLSAEVCRFSGVEFSSPTLGTSLMNLSPALTFILAILFRMERMDWKSSSSQAKLAGTVLSISGAFIATFYKGSPISITASPHLRLSLSPRQKWILGGVLFAGEALMTSLWYIVQALILEGYPVPLIIAFYLYLLGTIMTALFSLATVRDMEAWFVRLDTGLLAVLYSGTVGGALRIALVSWCLKKAGPVYVSMFKPVGIIFAVVLGVIFLGDLLCLGSVIGAAVIVCGFYAVMWGKAEEAKTSCDDSEVGLDTESHHQNQKTPLLAAQQR